MISFITIVHAVFPYLRGNGLNLILTVNSFRKDSDLVWLILISKMNYKIVLYETYFNSCLQVFRKISVASKNSLTTFSFT
jgi:hypothetical protein